MSRRRAETRAGGAAPPAASDRAASPADAAAPRAEPPRRPGYGSAWFGWLVCALLAAAFLAPAIVRGGFGPADMLLGMTPWSAYADRFPAIRGVANPQLDVIQQYFPWRMYAADWLRRGVVPLWNPHAYCGQPFVGNVLSAVFYPVGWLATGMPVGRFFLLSAWFHLTLLGGGMWLLLRGQGLRVAAALGGAAVMMLNGFVVGWLAYAPLSQWTFGWAPLVLWSWQRAWADRRPARLGWTSLLLAVSACGGHVQIAFAVGLAWAVFALGTLIGERRWREMARWVLVPAALGGLLAALQMLPAYEMAGLSGRTGRTYADALGSRLPPSMLVLLWVPQFFGHNALQLPVTMGGQSGVASFWGPYPNAIEASVSSGAGALWLSVAALLWRRSADARRHGLIALIGLLLAFGTPLYALCFHGVPGFSSLSGLSRWMCLWCLGTAALAGHGIEALSGEIRGTCPRRAGFLFAGATVVVLLGAFGLEAGAGERLTAFVPGLGGWVLSRCGLALAVTLVVAVVAYRRARRAGPWLAVVVTAELWLLGGRMHPGVDPAVCFFATPETEYLRAVGEPFRLVGVPLDPERGFLDWFPMNTPMAYGLSSPSGSESLSYAAYRTILAEFCEPGWQPRLDSPWLDALGVRYAVSRADLSTAGWRRVGGERVGVWENPEARGILYGAEPGELAADSLPAARFSLDATLATPQRWYATIDRDQPAAAVLTTPTSVGWRARVDGRAAAIRPVGRIFGAVETPGRSVVRFWYAPTAYRLGLFATLCAVAALLALTIGERKR